MKKSNKQFIEDFGEDDMPCHCEICHEWFDLNEGLPHPRKKNLTICESCADKIQEEVDAEEEISDIESEISDAEYTIREGKKRIQELKVKFPYL